MEKNQALSILKDARAALSGIPKAIIELTKDKAFELFDINNIPEDLYDLPIGYNVNKYDEYDQGAIMKVCGEEVTLFFTGELYGQTWQTELNQISFDNQVDLLAIIVEKME